MKPCIFLCRYNYSLNMTNEKKTNVKMFLSTASTQNTQQTNPNKSSIPQIIRHNMTNLLLLRCPLGGNTSLPALHGRLLAEQKPDRLFSHHICGLAPLGQYEHEEGDTFLMRPQ